MLTLFRALSVLPLWLLHAVGWALGWVAYMGSAVYRARLRDNAAQAGVSRSQLHAAIGESGKLVAEVPRLWFGAPVPMGWDGAHWIEAAHAQGRGRDGRNAAGAVPQCSPGGTVRGVPAC